MSIFVLTILWSVKLNLDWVNLKVHTPFLSKDMSWQNIQRIAIIISNVLERTSKKNKLKGLLRLTYGYSGSDIERGTRVALLKSINTGILTYDIFYNSIMLVGGTAIHVERQDVLSKSRQINSSIRRNNENKKKNLIGPPEI